MASSEPKGKGLNSKGKDAVKHEWKGFAQCRLETAHILDMSEWVFTREDMMDRLISWVRIGFKVSMSSNENGTSFVCSMTDQDRGSSSYGYTLSAFAPDPVSSVKCIAYKHEVIMPEGWVLGSVVKTAYG